MLMKFLFMSHVLVITEKKPDEKEPENQFLVGIANFFMLFSKLTISDQEEKQPVVPIKEKGSFFL